MKIQTKLLLLFLYLSFLTTNIYANKQLIIATGEKQNSPFNKISKEILTEAYKKIDVDVNFQAVPSLRSLVMSDEGKIDGEMHRILGIEKKFLNLIRIPISINKINVVVFTKNKDIIINKIDDLKHYKIGIRRGVQFAENISYGMNVYKLEKIDQLFNMLQLGRIDIAIETSFAGIKTIKKLNLDGIHISETPILTKKLYHYLNKKHKEIIPLITKSLKEMEKNNIIQDKYEEKLKKNLF